MSIATVCAAIASALNNLPVAVGGTNYAVRAYDPPLPKLDTAQLPAAWSFTGPAQDSWNADEGLEQRQYAVQVAVMPVGQGTPTERETRLRPFITAVRDDLAGRPTLGGTVTKSEVQGDSGIIVLPEYGGNYIGFEVRLLVLEAVSRNYAADE